MIKKGMVVSLSDGKEYVLVDSVTYSNNKYFAAVLNDNSVDNIYYFKLSVNKNNENELITVSEDTDSKVIEALNNHMMQTF